MKEDNKKTYKSPLMSTTYFKQEDVVRTSGEEFFDSQLGEFIIGDEEW